MENRNFHTALIGGFRKKDVINYMAEEKRLQEELLEELRSSQAELEQQLEDARLSDDSNRLLSEDLQEEVDMLRQQLELAQGDLAACREAMAISEGKIPAKRYESVDELMHDILCVAEDEPEYGL